MVVCPCCGELLPASAVPGELCHECVHAMESREILTRAWNRDVRKRPPGVTILAIYEYAVAAATLAYGLGVMAGLVHRSEELQGRWQGFLLFLVFLAIAFVYFSVATGLWELVSWGRYAMIVLAFLDLVFGLHSAGRTIAAVSICYLFLPHVKAAFASVSTEPELPA